MYLHRKGQKAAWQFINYEGEELEGSFIFFLYFSEFSKYVAMTMFVNKKIPVIKEQGAHIPSFSFLTLSYSLSYQISALNIRKQFFKMFERTFRCLLLGSLFKGQEGEVCWPGNPAGG